MRGLLLSLCVGFLMPCAFATANQNDKKLTISGTYTFNELFNLIRKQTGKQVSYAHSTINDEDKVKIDLKAATIDEVLTMAFRGKNIRWIQSDNYISLSVSKAAILDSKIPTDTIPRHTVIGIVTDTSGIPLPGATVLVRGTSQGTTTDGSGRFTLRNIKSNAVLIIGYTGYEKRMVAVEGRSDIALVLLPAITELKNVEIFSTGYQKIPKERATGSFVQIDSELFNRRVSTNVLDRLDGITSGLIFNKNLSVVGGRNESDISIRSRSTIFSNPNPLIILDNFPYDGDISNLNPNDIESITILRDAAAASIWGAYSGNGVIVITSKSGKFNQPIKVAFNTNISLSEKPNLYYTPQMSINDYVDNEIFLFGKNAYNSTINSANKTYISPVVEILLKQRNNLISETEANQQIDELRNYDVRNDLNKYVYRPSVNQQYAFNINGGTQRNRFYFSLGYDRGLNNMKYNTSERFTLNAKNNYSTKKNKLDLLSEILLVKSATKNASVTFNRMPYDRLIDKNGNHLSLGGLSLRQSYIDTAGQGHLLDWNYRPLEELQLADNTSKMLDVRINIGLLYKVVPGLDVSVQYQNSNGFIDNSNYSSPESYASRNIINTFSQINFNTGQVNKIVPDGAIFENNSSSYTSNNIRGQINYAKNWGFHSITALAGGEARTTQTLIKRFDPLYGYNRDLESNAQIDFMAMYPVYYNGFSTARIPNNTLATNKRVKNNDNNISYFGNLAYSYDNRYTLTISGRKDQSNIFGVETNQKGVPLWSAGVSWSLSNENFYNLLWLPYLKFRITSGYSGNVNKSLSAYATASASGQGSYYNVPTARIINPPNPLLRWEKILVQNYGMEFSIHKGILSGSIEYYTKDGKDLLGDTPYDPTTGISQFRGNVSDMKGHGFDVILNSTIINRQFKWNSNFLLSFAKDKVSTYRFKQSTVSNYLSSTYTTPLEGYPLYALFSLKWAGLDAEGNPLGYLNNEVSNNYTAIASNTDLTTLVYNGPVNPTIFGSFRNSFSYNNIEVSANITYKFNYYFRRNSLSNTSLMVVAAGSIPSSFNPDYHLRWQKPGDEINTSVPSLLYPNNTNRSALYTNSDILVEKGDHIRLQDIQCSYDIAKGIKQIGIQKVRLYVYINNLGVLWRANKYGIDPDVVPGATLLFPNPRSYALGLNVEF